MEIQIISNEFIKPSSPTPHHLKTHKLSLLDQYMQFLRFPMIFFYPNNNDNVSAKSQLLKQSLSETLTRYYPFAGKVRDNLSIDCDDQGAYYVDARVSNCSLSEFLNQPNLPIPLLRKLYLDEPAWVDVQTGGCVLKIQVTAFPCGGVVIGALVSHVATDGLGFMSFLKDWATTSQKLHDPQAQVLSQCPSPNFDVSSLLPPLEDYPDEDTSMGMLGSFMKTGKIVTRRFIFDASAIATLKAKASSPNGQIRPTRIQAISALLWKSIMAAFKAKTGVQRPCVITHVVSMCSRAEPPIPELYIGNLILKVAAQSEDVNADLDELVFKQREAIKKIDGELVKKIQGEGGYPNLAEFRDKMFGSYIRAGGEVLDLVSFSSWCNFGLYGIDFGWGKPAWTSCAGVDDSGSMFVDLVILMDTRSGEGVEAWVNVSAEDMARLENDQELLAFASMDPSPLEIN